MPSRRSTRELLWEVLPASGLVGILTFISADLEHYEWFSKSTNLYIWTIIWTATFLVSRRFPGKQGPLLISGTGTWKNFCMLWELYGLLGVERCGCTAISVADLVIGSVASAVAVCGSYYLAACHCRLPGQFAECDEENYGEEKPARSSQTC